MNYKAIVDHICNFEHKNNKEYVLSLRKNNVSDELIVGLIEINPDLIYYVFVYAENGIPHDYATKRMLNEIKGGNKTHHDLFHFHVQYINLLIPLVLDCYNRVLKTRELRAKVEEIHNIYIQEKTNNTL